MKKIVQSFVLVLGMLASVNAFAFTYAYAFHDPLFPTYLYSVTQDHKEYNSAIGKYHIGEDRSRNNTSNCDDDIGDAVYSVANGLVTYAQDGGTGWGNVVIVRHILPDLTRVHSLYGHLNNFNVSVGQEVVIGQQIGQMGDANGLYCAHLHFELRTDRALEKSPGFGYAYTLGDPIWNSHTDPSQFLSNN